MNLKQLGIRIKSQREKRQLRQLDVANALQISAQAVSKWERGENAPDISILLDLALLLDVSVEWLLGGNTPQQDTFDATVFCTSLNGFAEKSATMPPRDVALWANGIYYSLTEAVKQFGGVPIKYVGDGFLSFFARANHSQRAFQAALEARKILQNSDLIIALHRGDIYLGTIGHPDYAGVDVIGQTVNTAFLAMRWIAENCLSGIGVTQTVADSIPKQVKLCGEVLLCGMNSTLSIYEPVSLGEKK